MRVLMRAMLGGFGIRNVREASDVIDGLQIFNTGSIDLVLIDIKLMGVDGFEFCRTVRTSSDSANPFVPIIMISGYSERHNILQAINAGVDEFLVKPIRPADLASRINAVIERRRPFIKAFGYFGPDRRRRTDPRYKGPFRREADQPEIEI
ncbi:response regulator [bacterium]|nr:response regulator [bacterium]